MTLCRRSLASRRIPATADRRLAEDAAGAKFHLAAAGVGEREVVPLHPHAGKGVEHFEYRAIFLRHATPPVLLVVDTGILAPF